MNGFAALTQIAWAGFSGVYRHEHDAEVLYEHMPSYIGKVRGIFAVDEFDAELFGRHRKIERGVSCEYWRRAMMELDDGDGVKFLGIIKKVCERAKRVIGSR